MREKFCPSALEASPQKISFQKNAIIFRYSQFKFALSPGPLQNYLFMAPTPEAMRIWVDVLFTGAEGYREFQS